MGKIIRILVAIIVILSFVLLGRDDIAWAANPGADPATSKDANQSPDIDRHCRDDRSPRDHCDDDDDDDGTVKPPRHRIKVCKLGTFSVGGVATIQIQRLGRKDCVTAFTEAYNSKSYPPLPSGTQALTDVLSVKLPKKNAAVKICFAVPPGKGASIYTISRRAWTAVGSGNQGTICTETSRSGTYILLR